MYCAAGSCVRLVAPVGTMVEHQFLWVSDASGNVTAVMDDAEPIDGVLWRIVTSPTGAPTALYDVQLLDASGADVLLGRGADRSGTVVETLMLYDAADSTFRIATSGRHTLKIANAGNAKSGVVYLRIIPISNVRNCPAGKVLQL